MLHMQIISKCSENVTFAFFVAANFLLLYRKNNQFSIKRHQLNMDARNSRVTSSSKSSTNSKNSSNIMDESNSRKASSTRDATIAGRPSTAGMPIIAVMPAMIFISFSLFFHFSLKRRADKTKCKEFLLSTELFTGKKLSSRLP
jgi:hypothetical protein